jgi:hypothetical protein
LQEKKLSPTKNNPILAGVSQRAGGPSYESKLHYLNGCQKGIKVYKKSASKKAEESERLLPG